MKSNKKIKISIIIGGAGFEDLDVYSDKTKFSCLGSSSSSVLFSSENLTEGISNVKIGEQ